MAPAFDPRMDILPPAQRELWLALAAVPPEFVLDRGTALALHLGRRESVDFDYGPRFNPLLTLKELLYFEDGDLRRLPDVAKNRLSAAVRAVDPASLSDGPPG
jgi:hypothetical protein